MGSVAITDRYELSRLISTNNIAESWVAVNLQTGQKCFLKIASRDSSLGTGTTSRVLNSSFKLQNAIGTTRILTGLSKRRFGERLLIEYPYLETGRWRTLDTDLFWGIFPDGLVQMCQIVDYLHQLEVVHCDLSLGNFLIASAGNTFQVRLTDLDFLVASGTLAKAMLFGKPEHVAPEILRDDIITTQADNYSMGVLLRLCLDKIKPAGSIKVDKWRLKNMPQLVEELTSHNPHIRPVNLLDAVYRLGLIDESTYQAAILSLLSMLMTTLLLKNRREIISGVTSKLASLIERRKILGLPEELLNDISKCFSKNPIITLEVVKSHFPGLRVERYADYWQVIGGEQLLHRVYQDLGKIDTRLTIRPPEPAADSIEKMLRAGQAKIKQGQLLKVYLQYKKIVDSINFEDPGISRSLLIKILKALVSVSDSLQFSDESLALQSRLLSLVTEGSDDYFAELKNQITRHFFLYNLTGAGSLIDEGLRIASRNGADEWQLAFSRLRGWVLAAEAKYTEAERLYNATIDKCQVRQLPHITVECYNDLGATCWRQGDFGRAKDYYELAYKTASEHGFIESASTALANLAMFCFENAEYKKAISYSRKILKFPDNPTKSHLFPRLYLTDSSCFARLGRYDKAQVSLQKYLTGTKSSSFEAFYTVYYANLGWLQLQSGNFELAENYLHKALGLHRSSGLEKNKAKVWHLLAELYLYRGQSRQCLDRLTEARSIFARTKDRASIAEADLIETWCHFYDSNMKDTSRLRSQYSQLLDNNCYHYSALCLMHLYLNDHTAAADVDLAPLKKLMETSSAPLYKVLRLLVNSSSETSDDSEGLITAYKDAYKILESIGYFWHSAIVCYGIAGIYSSQKKYRVARNYMDQAESVLKSLGNETLARRYSRLIGGVVREATPVENRLQGFLGISEILKNIDDYSTALDKVVNFAIEETGAERGALLLYAKDSEELKIKSYIDCDQQSLVDIVALSRNIPLLTLEDISPLMIENAQKDPRTKDFKSVYMHNIRSVICIPVVGQDKVHGILYLDHHTIPALFDDSDLTFAYSLGNFLALIIETLQRYKSSELHARQTQDRLAQLGAGDNFITRDISLQQMLAKLPEFARTNASILILGESGTGKEILSRMIHRYSLRTDQPLVKLNCAAIPPTLIESELFGISKGVATGVEERKGKFELADQGTLLLDEIGDMPLSVQAKVLRVLEYQEFERVGGHRTIYTDIRFIYATNKNLSEMIKKGQFRHDLYHRINTITIEITPLRERPGDLPELIEYFIHTFATDTKHHPIIPSQIVEKMMAYDWPGNVRELKNVVERLCITYPGKTIELADLPSNVVSQGGDKIDHRRSAIIEKSRLNEALIKYNWNQSQAAESLNMPLSTFRRRIKKYGLDRSG